MLNPLLKTPFSWLFLKIARKVDLSEPRLLSMPNMTGRPGHRTMEMIGGSSAPYLACTPCVNPLVCTLFIKGGSRRVFRLPGAGGDHFHFTTVEPSPGHIRCRLLQWDYAPSLHAVACFVVFGMQFPLTACMGLGGRHLAQSPAHSSPKRVKIKSEQGKIGIVQKVFSEKASAIAKMRQKCVRNASKMRQKCVKMGLVLLGKEERPKCVRNPSNFASKVRGTPLGENTFWTIPKKAHSRLR